MIMTMDPYLVSAILAVLGLVVGSFGGATVWRLRAAQLKEDKAAGEHIDEKQYNQLKQLLGKSVSDDRSVCLHCHHRLEWYDLVPLVSWVALKGKCRYCHKPIGSMEPVIELGMATFFVISYLIFQTQLNTPIDMLQFVLWLGVGAGLIILFAYDCRWFLLPNKVVFPIMGLAGISAAIRLVQADDLLATATSLLLSVIILSGIYYTLYIISRGAWIGFGDIKLGVVLALMLGEWQLAFLALFLANIIGCLAVLPGLFSGKLKRSSHIPFGPMLIAGYFIVGLYGQNIIDWYLGLMVGI